MTDTLVPKPEYESNLLLMLIGIWLLLQGVDCTLPCKKITKLSGTDPVNAWR
jgi:hypothetical protein